MELIRQAVPVSSDVTVTVERDQGLKLRWASSRVAQLNRKYSRAEADSEYVDSEERLHSDGQNVKLLFAGAGKDPAMVKRLSEGKDSIGYLRPYDPSRQAA